MRFVIGTDHFLHSIHSGHVNLETTMVRNSTTQVATLSAVSTSFGHAPL